MGTGDKVDWEMTTQSVETLRSLAVKCVLQRVSLWDTLVIPASRRHIQHTLTFEIHISTEFINNQEFKAENRTSTSCVVIFISLFVLVPEIKFL